MRRDKNRQPYVKPVEHIELNEKKIKPRAVAAAVFLALGVAAITYGIVSPLTTDSGWRVIEPGNQLENSCGGEFIFNYNIGASGVSAGTEYRAITNVYGDAVTKATKIFTDRYFYDTNNLYTVNQSPNEEVLVEPALYDALELLDGRREIFYAPYYAEYQSLFLCADDNEAYNFDPTENPDMTRYFEELSAFVNDEKHVSLELRGNNRVMLRVSEEYLEFAGEYYITSFVDFFWMRNAFIIDYLADSLIREGYTRGAISSFDGYTRNLDSSGESYGTGFFDRVGNTVYRAAEFTYSGALSICFFRDFMLNDLDTQYYYTKDSGETLHKYIGSDGCPVSAVSSMMVCSPGLSCAELVLSALPVYLSPTLDISALKAMYDDNPIGVAYCSDYVIHAHMPDEQYRFAELYDKDGVRYTIKEE